MAITNAADMTTRAALINVRGINDRAVMAW